VEEDGFAFYDAAAKHADNPKVKEVFERLRDDELKHIETLKNLEKEFEVSEPEFADNPDILSYIHSIFSSHIFGSETDASEIAEKAKSESDAIAIGIRAEKDSILYYSEAAAATKDLRTKEVFKALVGEEKRHLMLLTMDLSG
jgi:rubrerythrin